MALSWEIKSNFGHCTLHLACIYWFTSSAFNSQTFWYHVKIVDDLYLLWLNCCLYVSYDHSILFAGMSSGKSSVENFQGSPEPAGIIESSIVSAQQQLNPSASYKFSPGSDSYRYAWLPYAHWIWFYPLGFFWFIHVDY